MDYKDLKYEIQDRVALITLNRPKYRNAFSNDMLESLAAAIERSQKDPDVHALILTGEGKSFCAGGDIKNFVNPEMTPWEMKDFLQEKVHPVARNIERLDKPLIGAINGPAYGAGMDMALMCDIRIASDRAEFCEVYIKLGLAPGDGGAFLLPRVVGLAKALEWLLTGKTIDVEEAHRYGLVNMVVPHEKLMEASLGMARKISDYSQLGVRLTKKAVYQAYSSHFMHHLDYISSQMGLLTGTDYFKEAVGAFAKKGSHPK